MSTYDQKAMVHDHPNFITFLKFGYAGHTSAPNDLETLPYATRMILVSSEPPPAKAYSVLIGGGA